MNYSFFTSKKEKILWFSAIFVVVIIYSTLFIGQPLAKYFESQNIQAVYFIIGMIMVGMVISIHAIFGKATKIEIAALIGIITIYFMLFLRLGLAERSHLIEYSILAIIIHKALITRKENLKLKQSAAVLGVVLTLLISILDEALQLFIPSRVFDYYDIIFNAIVIITAIGFYSLVQWIKERIQSNK
jgi:hypothetical protein